MRIKKIFEIVFICIFFFVISTRLIFGEESVIDCSVHFAQTGECPPEQCFLQCLEPFQAGGCILGCTLKDCLDIEAQFCPEDSCQLLKGCGDREVCYYKNEEPQRNSCGELAYVGTLECCEGLIKRCGIEFFDGSCDMLSEHSSASVPLCLPCGNGICNQFENRCNCPEDCV